LCYFWLFDQVGRKGVHPLVPEFIIKNYSAGITGGSFSAVGLFVDISGFSAMTDALMEHGQHGAEVLAEVMRVAFRSLLQCVYEQGGFVVSQAGDSFNALIPLGPDPADAVKRALTAAWNIRSRAAEKRIFDTPYGSFSITVKTGVASGETAWGIVTSADNRRAAYYFQGTAVDGAAEAEQFAGPGDVIVDAAFQRQAENLATYEAVGAFYRLLDLTCAPALALSFTLPALDLNYASMFFPQDLFLQQQSGEFRRCTYLFVRLPTVRTQTQLRIFMQTIFELQDLYGGLLELRFGDKGAHLLLIWGAPRSYENDVERSLNFIYELQTRTTIPINAGVTNHIAHAGFIGSELAEEYSAFGRGANLAARFMTAAPRGEIWVGENVVQQAERSFEFEYRGQQFFKGFSQPQKYFILLERKEHKDTAYDGQLIGRHAELERLQAFVQPIFSGQFAGIIVVRGDPGIGKSRLVHEFISSLSAGHPGSFQLFLAQTDEIIRQPFNPLQYWLRQYFDVSDTQNETRNKRSFNRKIDDLILSTTDSELAEELDRTRSFLGALVGLYWSDSLFEQLEARERYENTLTALNVLIQSECLQKPVILLLEDIHRLDEDSRKYLPVLLHSMTVDSRKQFPFAILATARLEEESVQLDGFAYSEIQLKQLNRSALAALAAFQLDSTPAQSLLDLLVERSEGNPYFAEEMLRYLQQNNLLDCQPDGCIVISDQKETLPVNIGLLLVAHLDSLPKDVKRIAQMAAVLGREFDLNLLAHMLQEPQHLEEKVQIAKQAAIWIQTGQTRYIFKHALMRDAAYTMLVISRRKELHERAVEALETVYQGNLNTHYGELAFHALQAGLVDQARRYFKLAGDAAQQAYQNALAVEYFSQAINMTPGNALLDKFDLVHARLLLYEQMGLVEERRNDLKHMEALSGGINQSKHILTALLNRANFELDLDAYEDALRTAQQAVALGTTTGEYSQLATAYRYAALALFRMGIYEPAVEQMHRAIESAQQLHDPALHSSIFTNLGLIYLDQERDDEALQMFDKALQIAEGANLLLGQATSLNNLAQIKGLRGNFLEAQRYFQQSLDIARKIGSRRNEGLVLGNLGWVAANLGDYQAAYNYQQDNLRISRQTGSRFPEVFAMINLSAVSSALGSYTEGEQWAEQALVLARQINHANAEAWALTYLGHAQFALGKLSEAAAAYGAAVVIRSQLNQSILLMEPLTGLARTSLAGGKASEAYTQLEPVLEQLDTDATLNGTDEPLRIYHTCYLVLSELNDDRATAVLEKGYSVLQARIQQIPDPVIRQKFVEDISHHRQLRDAWINKNRSVETDR
jgi:predicted ATPase/class 3 adenylate cyclase